MGDWQWARWAELVFIQNAILLTLVIVIPGQLVTQLVATGRMLSFLEMGFAPMYTVVLPSLGMEALGLAHLAYGTALSGSISTILTVLSWSFAGIYMCGALPSPVCA